MFGKKAKTATALPVAPIPDDNLGEICDPSAGILYKPVVRPPSMDYTPEERRALILHKPGHLERMEARRHAMAQERIQKLEEDVRRETTQTALRELLRNSEQFQDLVGMLARLAHVDDKAVEAMERQAAATIDEAAIARDAALILDRGADAIPAARRPRTAPRRQQQRNRASP